MTERTLKQHRGEKWNTPWKIDVSQTGDRVTIVNNLRFNGETDFTTQESLSFTPGGQSWRIVLPSLMLEYTKDDETNTYRAGIVARRDGVLTELAQIDFNRGVLIAAKIVNLEHPQTNYETIENDAGINISLMGGMPLFRATNHQGYFVVGVNMDRDSRDVSNSYYFLAPQQMNEVVAGVITKLPNLDHWQTLTDKRIEQIGEVVHNLARLLMFGGTSGHGNIALDGLNKFSKNE